MKARRYHYWGDLSRNRFGCGGVLRTPAMLFRSPRSWAVILSFLFVGLAGLVLSRSGAPENGPSRPIAPTRTSTGLYFEPLSGAWRGSGYDFFTRARGISALIGSGGILLKLTTPEPRAPERFGMRPASHVEPRYQRPHEFLVFRLLNAKPDAAVVGEMPTGGVSSYFLGAEPTAWRSGIRHYGRVKVEQAYRGVDLVAYFRDGVIEYDFEIAPGADPAPIGWEISGAQEAHIDEAGQAIFQMDGARLAQPAPRAWQPSPRGELPVASRFVLESGAEGRYRLSFQLGAVDPELPVVIDPALARSAFVGGSGSDPAFDLAVDRQGSVYLTGQTASADFPTTPGAFLSSRPANGDSYAFVTKLDPSMSRIVYSTYLGGTGYTLGDGLTIDAEGNVFLTGETRASGLPTTAGSAQRALRGGVDAFIAKLNAGGTGIIYFTYLGGSGGDYGRAIAVNAAGEAYVVGTTDSSNFPTTAGVLQNMPGGAGDAFVTQLSADGSRFVYSTYAGGNRAEQALDVQVDPAGNVYIAGWTDTLRALGPTDGFCFKISPRGSELLYVSLFGGNGSEYGQALAVDEQGHAYIVGSTSSLDFPVTAKAVQREFATGGGSIFPPTDAFLVKLSPKGDAVLYGTYLGGNGDDEARGVGLAPDGKIWLAGNTTSFDFPNTPDALPTDDLRPELSFVSRIDLDAGVLDYSTYFGGERNDRLFGLEVAPDGTAYIAGMTNSTRLPASQGGPQPGFVGGSDVLVARFAAFAAPLIAPGGIVGAADFASGAAAPGQFLSLFGSDLGPKAVASLELGLDGRVATELAGTRVLFDGIAAPMIFTSAGQLSMIAPYGIAGRASVAVVVEYNGVASAAVDLAVGDTAPAIFTQSATGMGPGAVLNQDATLNTPENPARRGEIISIYGTGEGLTDPPGVDGLLAAAPYPKPLAAIGVLIGGVSAVVHYAGAAPGLAAGVLQVNAEIPGELELTAPAMVEVRLIAGEKAGRAGVTLAVAP